MAKNSKIEIQGTGITILKNEKYDFNSLSDISRFNNSEHTETIIQN